MADLRRFGDGWPVSITAHRMGDKEAPAFDIALGWVPLMSWKRARQRQGLGRSKNVWSTITRRGAKLTEWTVYNIGRNQWAIGVGIVGENGLHYVIGNELIQSVAQHKVRMMAAFMGHKWGSGR